VTSKSTAGKETAAINKQQQVRADLAKIKTEALDDQGTALLRQRPLGQVFRESSPQQQAEAGQEFVAKVDMSTTGLKCLGASVLFGKCETQLLLAASGGGRSSITIGIQEAAAQSTCT